MPQTTPLTQAQQEALSLIAAGSTMASAADQLAIHRNTIGNWLRSSNFRQALELACLDQSIFWRDHAHQMAADALAAIQAILTDPKSPAAVPLRAALATLDKAPAPLPEFPPISSRKTPRPKIRKRCTILHNAPMKSMRYRSPKCPLRVAMSYVSAAAAANSSIVASEDPNRSCSSFGCTICPTWQTRNRTQILPSQAPGIPNKRAVRHPARQSDRLAASVRHNHVDPRPRRVPVVPAALGTHFGECSRLGIFVSQACRFFCACPRCGRFSTAHSLT